MLTVDFKKCTGSVAGPIFQIERCNLNTCIQNEKLTKIRKNIQNILSVSAYPSPRLQTPTTTVSVGSLSRPKLQLQFSANASQNQSQSQSQSHNHKKRTFSFTSPDQSVKSTTRSVSHSKFKDNHESHETY